MEVRPGFARNHRSMQETLHSRSAAAWSGYLAASLSVVFWGASFVATRVALSSLTPFGLVAARLTIGALVLFAVLRARSGRILLERVDWLTGVGLAALLAFHLDLQAVGLQYTTAINTGWIIGFIPVLIALSAHLLGRQRLRPRGWLGLAVASAGVALVMTAKLTDFAHARIGDALQIASCFTWTLYTLAGTEAIRRNGAIRMTAWVMAVAAVLSWAPPLSAGLTHAPMTPNTWLSLLFLGCFCSGVALTLWYIGVTRCGPTSVGALLYFEPFVTSAVSLALLHEPMTPWTVAGAVTVFAGVWLVGHGVSKPHAND